MKYNLSPEAMVKLAAEAKGKDVKLEDRVIGYISHAYIVHDSVEAVAILDGAREVTFTLHQNEI